MEKGQPVPARLIPAVLAVVAALGTTQPWAEFVLVTFNGTEFEPGLAELAVGVLAAAVSVWGAVYGPRGVAYYLPALVCGAVLLIIPVWFMVELARRSTTEFFGVSVTLLDPGGGLYLSLAGAAGYAGALVLQLMAGGKAAAAPSRGSRVTCGDCGTAVSMTDRQCPSCGKVFASPPAR
jgi:hypothetical protein